jgi:hypothetical protein
MHTNQDTGVSQPGPSTVATAPLPDELDALLALLIDADRIQARIIALVARLQASGAAEATTGVPLELWLAARGRRTRADRRMLGTAADTLQRLPSLAAAFAGGRVSWSQVRALALRCERLPAHVCDAVDDALAREIDGFADAEPEALLHAVSRALASIDPADTPHAARSRTSVPPSAAHARRGRRPGVRRAGPGGLRGARRGNRSGTAQPRDRSSPHRRRRRIRCAPGGGTHAGAPPGGPPRRPARPLARRRRHSRTDCARRDPEPIGRQASRRPAPVADDDARQPARPRRHTRRAADVVDRRPLAGIGRHCAPDRRLVGCGRAVDRARRHRAGARCRTAAASRARMGPRRGPGPGRRLRGTDLPALGPDLRSRPRATVGRGRANRRGQPPAAVRSGQSPAQGCLGRRGGR